MKPITLRIDVDYAYPSRTKSFLYTYLGAKTKHRYLEYTKMLADLINNAESEVKAYWFFTPHTLPDSETLVLLSPSRHEIGLHVVNDPWFELAMLERVVPKRIQYYTIHGTERLLGQVVWHRKLGQKQGVVNEGFPLQSFHKFPTYGIDTLCRDVPKDRAMVVAKRWVEEGRVLEMHPDFLVKDGGLLNHRAAYFDVLKSLLYT